MIFCKILITRLDYDTLKKGGYVKITLGEKDTSKKYDFRETCFGIFEKNGKIAVIYNKNQYSLIGGGVDKGESKIEALKREFKEEVGYEISIIKPLCIIDCFWMAGGKWPMESLANFYIVNIGEKINDASECFIEYVSKNELEKLLPLPYQKKAIELYLNLKNKKD